MEYRIGALEKRFAEMIWKEEPIASGKLARLAGEELGWKKSTTYTVLHRLCERGLFQNEGGIVTSLITREEFMARQSEGFLEETFGGSLPAFLTAFASRRKLTRQEIDKLQDLIDQMGEGER